MSDRVWVRAVGHGTPDADEGLAVETAPADRALAGLEGADCLLIEHDPPETDALELVERLRERRPSFPAVLVVGTERVEAALAAGATDVVAPTAGPGLVAHRVRRAVDGAAATGSERGADRSRRLLDAMSTTLHDYAFVYDRSGEYLEAIVGRQESDLYTREEIVGLRVPEVFPEPVADRLLDTIETALETGEVETVEYPLEKPGGTSWYEAHMARIPGGYGGQPAVLTSAMDVTERREREQALERQNERLERFANIVSHDLRNPLDIAMGRTQIARETGDLEHLDSVATALERMEELVGDLLTLAREGEAVGDLAEVSLAEVAADCWETVDTADAELVVETDRRILADGGRLRQLLENLVRNAVEHAGPEVTVTVGDCEGGFYVADDGPGIEAPERVFESGYTTRDDGTGFGLAIVEQITHAHGWSVTAVDDDGARFEVTGVETP